MPIENVQLALPIPLLHADELPLIQCSPVCTCGSCGTEHAAEDSREHEGQQYCPDCSHCPTCGDVFATDDGLDVHGTTHCENCVHCCDECDFRTTDENELHNARTSTYSRGTTHSVCNECSWECADCSQRFTNSADNYANASGDRVCERCAEEYGCCNDCGGTFRNDDLRYLESDDASYCPDCSENHDCGEEDSDTDDNDDSEPRYSRASSAPISDYSYKPAPIFLRTNSELLGLTYDSPRREEAFAGIELEVDRKDSRGIQSRESDVSAAGLQASPPWYCKHDGSLINGFEVVSHPGTWEYWKSHSFDWCEKLTALGYRSYDTNTCGMHVHISKSFLGALSRYKLLHFFRNNQTLITRLSRRENGTLERWAAIDVGSSTAVLMRKAKGGAPEKYEAVNFKPKKTVEFRFFRGTLNVQSIRRNIALVFTICHFVRETSLQRLTQKDFLTWLTANAERVLHQDATYLITWVRAAVRSAVPADLNQ